MRKIVLVALLASSVSAQIRPPDVLNAITKALPLLQSSAATFVAKRACVSCHHNILPILLLHLARDRGVVINDSVLASVEGRTFRALSGPAALDDAIQA